MKEKLIELLTDVIPHCDNELRYVDDERVERLADHLIANGVIISKMETVATDHNAVEVVQGRWMWDVESHGDPMYGIDEDYGYRCSACGVWASEYGVDGDIFGEPPTPILHYCPNCGAKMDGERKDNEG